MFTCDFCSKPIGPRIKPIIVVLDFKPAYYSNVVPVFNEDPEARPKMELKHSHGLEIVQEFKQCQACAPHAGQNVVPIKVEPKTISEPLRPTFKQSLALMAGMKALDRVNDRSKRGKREGGAYLAMLQNFQSRGGKVVLNG